MTGAGVADDTGYFLPGDTLSARRVARDEPSNRYST